MHYLGSAVTRVRARYMYESSQPRIQQRCTKRHTTEVQCLLMSHIHQPLTKRLWHNTFPLAMEMGLVSLISMPSSLIERTRLEYSQQHWFINEPREHLCFREDQHECRLYSLTVSVTQATKLCHRFHLKTSSHIVVEQQIRLVGNGPCLPKRCHACAAYMLIMLSPLGVSSKRMIGSSWFLAGLLRLIYTEFYGNLGIFETKDAPHWSFVENLKNAQ